MTYLLLLANKRQSLYILAQAFSLSMTMATLQSLEELMVLRGSTQYPNNELCKFLKEVVVQLPTQCGPVLELWCLASLVESRSLKARKSYQHSVLTPGALRA
jgi:hypothetical protein